MKVKKINQREPTRVKVPDKTKASELQKKKLYRQRTVEEVQKSLHFMENVYDDEKFAVVEGNEALRDTTQLDVTS